MRKGKDIVGKPVVAYDSGEKVETIVDLIFDQYDNRLLGFLIDEGGWFSNAKILPLNLVKAIGVDAVIIQSKEAIALASDYAEINKILENNNILNGTRIMTTDGRDLGTLIDFYFDEQTGAVEGYEASGGLFADAYSGRSFVPAPQTLKIGEDVAFVPAETAALMEEQVGGLKAAMQNAGEKIQETAQVAGEKLQETAQVAGEKLQATAQVAGDTIQEAGRVVSAKVTDTIVDPAAQKAFAIDKVAQKTVEAPDGGQLVTEGSVITSGMCDAAEHLGILDELYRSAGGTLTKPLGERMDTAVAGLTIEQTAGRRAQQAVYTPEGYIVVAQGQIVTAQVINRARNTHQESALLNTVGLSTSGAAKSTANTLATNTGHQLKTTGAIASEQIQEGASQLWNKVKETASDLQGKSTQAIDEQRIKGALGRPTTRVILDLNDEVILNVGELITHKAIESARSAGILDLLLDSVYTETPHLSIEELRAPTAGKSAL
jgi:uncharacterized protein YrrD